MIAAIGFGALIGVLLGLFGGGGSILAVPALVYGAGLPLAAAVPTSLLVVGISSATALLPRLRAWLVTSAPLRRLVVELEAEVIAGAELRAFGDPRRFLANVNDDRDLARLEAWIGSEREPEP